MHAVHNAKGMCHLRKSKGHSSYRGMSCRSVPSCRGSALARCNASKVVPPAGCAGVVQAGFLSANTSVPAGALGVGANVVVPASGAVLGETFEAVLWLADAARPGWAAKAQIG